MKYQELLAILTDHYDDYEFEYMGKRGAICMFADEIIAGYDGSELHFENLDAVLAARFINGKTLEEVAHDLILI